MEVNSLQNSRKGYSYTASSGQNKNDRAGNDRNALGQGKKTSGQGQTMQSDSARRASGSVSVNRAGASNASQRPTPKRTSASGTAARVQRGAGGQNRSMQSGRAVTSSRQGAVTSVGQDRAVSPARPSQKNGLVGYWKRVLALTPEEKRHNEVVPRIVEGYDYVFLIIVIILVAFGSIMVYSASYAYSQNKYGDSYYVITRQAIFVVIGIVLMIIAMRFPPDFYKRLAPLIYIGCFFLLCLVPIPGIGVYHKGARRWLKLGIEFQPSEMMKFGLTAMLAWYFDRYQKRVKDYENFWRASSFGIFFPYVIVGVTCVLIILEKHLSGTIIMFLIGTIIIFAGGAMKRWLGGMFGAGIALLACVGLFTDYTKRRIDLWFHPEEYPLSGGWQTLQGLYAIGSGGFFGVGIGESRQKHLYVSEPQNDFIFTIVCEELGFIGAVAVIALFMLFIYRGIIIAMRAPDTFSALLVTGIIGKVALQAIFNIAVVTQMLPNTGISLPFFSYGGTSLCILMAEMGVVLSVSRYSKQRR